MTDAQLLRALASDKTRRSAIGLLRRCELQRVAGGGYDYMHQLWRHHSTEARELARLAYAQANPNLGLGWRHRYCRAANWLVTERKRRWLEMPVRLTCSRCCNRRDAGHKTCLKCRMRRPA